LFSSTLRFRNYSLLRNYLKLFGEDSCVLIHFITFTKCFKIVDRKSFLNTQNPGTCQSIDLIQILNVFIGQFWIFEHYRPWSMTAMEHGTACSAVCSVQKSKHHIHKKLRKYSKPRNMSEHWFNSKYRKRYSLAAFTIA
jgi:hypothetical protein